MGTVISMGKEALEMHRQRVRSRKIDQNLIESSESQISKLLLLGPGESGKSTILKQMRILHDDGFTAGEQVYLREVIYSNTITSLSILIEALKKFNISLKGPGTVEDIAVVEEVIRMRMEAETISEETGAALMKLWADPGIQEAFNRRTQFQIPDNAKHFLDSLDRICLPSYSPTQDDMLRARVRTTGIVQIEFEYTGKRIAVVDVGGQRSERRKWIHAFDNCDAVIFVAAISEFNQVIMEDGYTNRIAESLRLFDVILNGVYFSLKAFILFLNKTDLFDEKISDPNNCDDFQLCFPKFECEFTIEECRKYVKNQFLALNATPTRTIYTHFTCATDTQQIAKIVESVMELVVNKSVSSVGLY